MHAFVKYLNESHWLDNDKQNGQADLDNMQEAFNIKGPVRKEETWAQKMISSS